MHLQDITTPAVLRDMSVTEMEALAKEIRQELSAGGYRGFCEKAGELFGSEYEEIPPISEKLQKAGPVHPAMPRTGKMPKLPRKFPWANWWTDFLYLS